MQPNFKCLPLTSIVNVNWEKSEHSSIRNFRISRLTHLNFILNKLNHVLPPATCLIDVHSWHLLFDHFQFALIHGPNIPGSYAILLFTASDLASITSHIHNWVLFLLWLCLFILSGVIFLLFSSNILGTYLPGEFIFQCHFFLPFHSVHGVLKAGILKWFAISFSNGPCFVRALHHDLSILGGPTQHGLLFHWVREDCDP